MTDNGSLNLGSAYGSIEIRTDGVNKAIADAQKAFDAGIAGMGRSLEDFGQQLTNVGIAITKLTAPMSAFIVTGVKVAASFEDILTQIKVFGGVSEKEMSKVTDQVLDWGAKTVFSANDAGEAMLNLLKAGLSDKDATAAMNAVLKLAVVGNMSLDAASRAVTQTMAQYGLAAGDTTRIVDALAKADNASQGSVSDLSAALTNVGPIAKRFGLSVEDTTAILAVFANNGVKGAEAGQQLESMLTQMSRSAKPARKAWEALGTSLYDANGNVRPLNQVIKDLNRNLKNKTPEEQNKLIKDLAGSYGQMGLAALLAANGIDGMKQQMKDAPSAAAVEAASIGTFNRAIENLQGSIETLQIQVLTPFMNNVLKPMVNELIKIINAATLWAQKNPALANTIIMIGAALSVLGPALVVAGMAIGALGTVIAFVFSPIGLLIAGIAALAAAFITNFGGIRDFLMPIINEIVHFFTGENSLEAALKVLTTEGGPVTLFRNFMSNIGDFLSRAANSARELGQIAVTLLTKGLNDAANAADNLLKLGLLLVTDTLNKAAGAAGMLATMLILFVTKGLNDAANAADQLLKMGLLLIVDTLNKASIAAGMLGLLLQTLVIKVVTDLRNAAFDLAGRLAEVSTNVGYLITGLTLLLGVLVVARLIAMVQALATAIIAVATAIAGGGGLMLALNPLTLVLVLVAGLTLAATTNFLGFGDRLKDVKRIIDEAVTSAKQLVAIMDELARRFNTSQGFNVQNTGLSGVTTGGTGFSITKSNQRYQAWKDSGGAGGPPDWFMPELRDWGGMGQKNIPYLITPKAGNELFVPQTNGTFLPHFDQIMAQLAGGNGNGGMQFAPGSIVINANSYEGGVAAGKGFMAQIDEWRARKGQ